MIYLYDMWRAGASGLAVSNPTPKCYPYLDSNQDLSLFTGKDQILISMALPIALAATSAQVSNPERSAVEL